MARGAVGRFGRADRGLGLPVRPGPVRRSDGDTLGIDADAEVGEERRLDVARDLAMGHLVVGDDVHLEHLVAIAGEDARRDDAGERADECLGLLDRQATTGCGAVGCAHPWVPVRGRRRGLDAPGAGPSKSRRRRGHASLPGSTRARTACESGGEFCPLMGDRALSVKRRTGPPQSGSRGASRIFSWAPGYDESCQTVVHQRRIPE